MNSNKIPPQQVAGLIVGPDWLKSQPSVEDYRARLSLAFDIARSS